MTAFYHFLPDVARADLVQDDRLNRELLADCGLDRVLADVHLVPDQAIVADVRRGPGEWDGVTIYPIPADGELPDQLGYHAELQSWRAVGLGQKHWIGWLNQSPPAPADLERREIVAGYPVADAYDRQWIVPVLRSPDNPRGRLEPAFTWDENDQPAVGVDARYRDLWERSAQVWDLIEKNTDLTGGTFAQSFAADDDQFLFGYLVDCLAVNYRVSNSVLATLDKITPGWLSQAAGASMLNATTDLFAYREYLAAKKKSEFPSVPAGCDSGAGIDVAIRGTVPAEASKP